MTNLNGLREHSVRPLDWTPTEFQVKPHAGFATGVVHVGNSDRLESEGDRTLLLATPPEWMQRDDLRCANRWETYDEHKSTKRMSQADRARKLCEECPVKRECLAYAFEFEGWGDTPSNVVLRHGIWGGTSPSGRRAMALAANKPSDEESAA